MTDPTVHPQTTLRVIGQIVSGAVILGVLRAVMDSTGVDLIWSREAFLQGAYLGVLAVIWDYRSLPTSHRLAPLPTMVFGLLLLAALIGVGFSTPRPPSEYGWLGWSLLLLVALIPIYLVTSSGRALWRERQAATSPLGFP